MSEIRENPLSLAFMRGHPGSAARVLEALSASEAVVIFQRAPARIGATVMADMLPRPAATCLAALDESRSLELLAAMSVQSAVSLLRYLPEARRQALVAGLPTPTAIASTLLLGYAESTLGAWADPGVAMMPAETRAEEALARLRQADWSHPVLFVTAPNRFLEGVVPLMALLRAPAAATLATLMDKPLATLAAHATLEGVLDDPCWELTSALPVVESGDRLVGLMTRESLMRAVRKQTPDAFAEAGAASGLPVLLARGYWASVSGLTTAALSLLPRVAPVRPAEQTGGVAHGR